MTYPGINLNKDGYITKEKLLQEVSDENIFRYYISNLEIGKAMNSPLRRDKIPSFGVFYARNHRELFFKDFKLGSGDCIQFVAYLYNLKRSEALSQIAVDFGLDKKYIVNHELNMSPVIGTLDHTTKTTYSKSRKVIGIHPRKWKKHDLAFWEQFGIPLYILEAYNVVPIKWLFINENVHAVSKHAYAFIEEKDGKTTYKIYQPYSKYKWISNHDRTVHQGYTQLPDTGELLIITKSLKDVMSLCAVAEIPAIGIQNEAIMIKKSVVDEYTNRFKYVFTLFDNDTAGVTLAFRYKTAYEIPMILLPYRYECKDFSDLVKDHEEANNILKNLINAKIHNSN